MVDESHAVLFGGFHSGSGYTNDVYMLDLSRMVSCTCRVDMELMFALSSCAIMLHTMAVPPTNTS